jgi:hypothetical protein
MFRPTPRLCHPFLPLPFVSEEIQCRYVTLYILYMHSFITSRRVTFTCSRRCGSKLFYHFDTTSSQSAAAVNEFANQSPLSPSRSRIIGKKLMKTTGYHYTH